MRVQLVCAQKKGAIRVPRGGRLGHLGGAREGFMEEEMRWSQREMDGKGRRAPHMGDIIRASRSPVL